MTNIENIEQNLEEIEKKKENILEKELSFFSEKINKIRSDRFSIEAIKGIVFNNNKKKIPIKQLCNFYIDQKTNQLVVTPDDPANLNLIVKLISDSNLGLRAINKTKKDCCFILDIITEEKKKELIKEIKLVVEQFKGVSRKIRDDFKNILRKNKKVSEDQKKNYEKKMERYVEECYKKIFTLENKKILELK